MSPIPRVCIDCRQHALPGQSRCPDHLGHSGWARYARKSPESAAFYKSGAWKVARMRHLRMNPTCVVCGQPATHVDHIRNRAEGGPDLAASNLQSLCAEHHQAKTQTESKRGRKRAAQQQKSRRRET